MTVEVAVSVMQARRWEQQRFGQLFPYDECRDFAPLAQLCRRETLRPLGEVQTFKLDFDLHLSIVIAGGNSGVQRAILLLAHSTNIDIDSENSLVIVIN